MKSQRMSLLKRDWGRNRESKRAKMSIVNS